MKNSNEKYKGYNIEKRIDVKSHTCIIYKSKRLIKCIVGDVFKDGSENSIKKAKTYINALQ